MNVAKLTIPEKILIATYEEWPNKGDVFTEADITVVAWRKFPETFGLKGYADQYPDSKHVLSNIMGQTKGLRGKRWISQLGATRYTLTQSGIDYAGELVSGDYSETEHVRKSLSDDHSRILKRLFGGMAYRLWREDRRDELIFRDACEFWNITPASTGEDLEDRLRNIDAVFALVRSLSKGERGVDVEDNRSLTMSDIDECATLNNHLQAMFRDDLSYIKKREKKHGIKRIRP